MTISALRSSLTYLKGGAVPSPMPRSSVYSALQNRPTSVHDQGYLRITVRAFPSRQSPRAPHASQALLPLESLSERLGPSPERPTVSFGAPADDQMSIAASEGELQSSGYDDSAALPPSGPSFIASGQQWLCPGRSDASAHSLCPSTEAGAAPHTQTPLRAAVPSESGPCIPARCPTTGTSVVPLVPLVRSLGAWLTLPSPSRWLIRTIRLGYAIQFARSPPAHSVHPCSGGHCPCAQGRDRSPTGKGRDRAGPSSRYEDRLLQPVLHCTQERWWVTTNLGPARPEPVPSQATVQDAYAETHFQMHPSPRLVCSDRPEGRVLSCLDSSSTQTLLRFAFEGWAYQYKVLPFGLALSPRVFTKVAEVAIAPMCERGVRILNYLDDWLILAQSREQLCEHRAMVLSHLSPLGLRVNWEKSKLTPGQRISFLGMELDSINMTARFTEARVQSVLNCVSTLRCRTAAPLKLFQRLLGHMASSAAVTPLGLLHMRPLQHWLHDRVLRWAWQSVSCRFQVTPHCRQTLSLWLDPSFLRTDSVHYCGPTEAVIRLVLSALVGVATVIIVVYEIRSRRAERDQAHIHTSGVFGEPVPVIKGDSATINSDLTEMKDDDVIQWRFGDVWTVIAEINKRADRITVYDDVLDGRFRDRLKLDNQTGSLTITNTTTEHEGYYELQINSESNIFRLHVSILESVMEGDSVSLNSDLTEMKDDDVIQWKIWFGDEITLIAEINKRADRITVYDDVLDGRFRDRLKLDNQTGSLTITDIRTEHEGHYDLLINSESNIFFLFVIDEVKSVSVKEGDSVSLNSSLTEIDDYLIQWRFKNTLIAEISKQSDIFTVYDDVLDGRFRDRLKLDNQTGSLTITNTTTEHAGDYQLLRFTERLSSKSFRVSAYDSVHCCGPTEAVIRLVLSALVGVATVIIVVYEIRSRRAEQDQAHIHTSALLPKSNQIETAGPSAEVPFVSFGAPDEDAMSIAASQGGQESSGSDDSAVLPPSGVPALSESDPELTAIKKELAPPTLRTQSSRTIVHAAHRSRCYRPPLSQSSRMTVCAAHGPRCSRPPLSPDPWQSRLPRNAGPSLVSSVRTRLMTMPPHRAAMPPTSGPVIPPRCTTEGMSVVRMTPLAQFLGAWLELHNLSRWVACTIRLGYTIQFARSPPRFRGVCFTMVGGNAPIMRAEVATLLAKGAIETLSP
ncbi:unnamed protein product [Leuciscus chuanchicus]